MKSIKACITFSPEQWRYLQAEAERQGVTASEVVRRCIGKSTPGFNDPAWRIIPRISVTRG